MGSRHSSMPDAPSSSLHQLLKTNGRKPGGSAANPRVGFHLFCTGSDTPHRPASSSLQNHSQCGTRKTHHLDESPSLNLSLLLHKMGS